MLCGPNDYGTKAYVSSVDISGFVVVNNNTHYKGHIWCHT